MRVNIRIAIDRMRALIPIVGLLLVCGCTEPPQLDHVDKRPDNLSESAQPHYITLTQRPDTVLDQLATTYPRDKETFSQRWTEDTSAEPLDGQRAIELLEVACYADVMCHRFEYPLRVATLDYIEENMNVSDVMDALRWINSSYESGLPLDEADDEKGVFRGVLVEAMGIRMREYADELLKPQVPSQHR
jgi:hypothetical protein